MKKQIVIKLVETDGKWTGVIYGKVDDKRTDYKSADDSFSSAHSCGVNLANKIPDALKWMEQIQ